MSQELQQDVTVRIDEACEHACDICDRCANMKIEELQSMMIDGVEEFWCAGCLAGYRALNA